MTESEIQRLLLDKFSVRTGPEMAKYVLRQMQHRDAMRSSAIPIMGANSRSGIPLRQDIDPALFQND